MNTLARWIGTLSVLGTAMLFSGCTTQTAVRSRPAGMDCDFSVVQSSSDRKLSAADLVVLKEAVAKFLAGQGLVRSGEYFVRVDFPPEAPGAAGDWVIVKLTNLPTPAYTLVGSYATSEPDYLEPYDVGYDSWASPYYFVPFGLYSGFYGWPSPWGQFHPGDYRPRGHRPGDHDDHPPGTHAGDDGKHDGNGWRDRDGHHYGDGRPPGTHARNDGNHDHDRRYDNDGRHDGDRRSRATNATPRTGDSNHPRGGSSETVQVARERTGGSTYTPPTRSEPVSRSEPASRSDSSSRSSSSNSGIQKSSNANAEK